MNAMISQSRLPVPVGTSVSPEQWRVLTEAIFPNAKTAEAIVLALEYCRARKLDVFKRPVHIVPMWNKQLRREVETDGLYPRLCLARLAYHDPYTGTGINITAP